MTLDKRISIAMFLHNSYISLMCDKMNLDTNKSQVGNRVAQDMETSSIKTERK